MLAQLAMRYEYLISAKKLNSLDIPGPLKLGAHGHV